MGTTLTSESKKIVHYGDYTNEELSKLPASLLIAIIKNWQEEDNFIIMTDSYKLTHHMLLPEGLEETYAYMEPRGGDMPYTVFMLLNYYIKKYIAGVRITPEKIEQARTKSIAHFGMDIFNDKLWKYIWENHGGRLPLEIKAVPEGTPVAIKNILMSIRNTDKKCAALTNPTETLLMKVWATNTVAAYARVVRELIIRYHSLTSDAPQFLIDFMHHDFGYRGCNSEETARILGAAALGVGFKGTDTMGALVLADKYYSEPMAGFSVIASEHSVPCAYGTRDQEFNSYKEIIAKVKEKCADVNPPSGVIILSLVSDTYNIYNVCARILPALKDEFIGWKNNHGISIKIVVRHDSNLKHGTASDVLFGYDTDSYDVETESTTLAEKERHDMESRVAADMNISLTEARDLVKKGTFSILFEQFGHTVNSKGCKVFHPQIGALQGDGVSYTTICQMYKIMYAKKLDIMNLVLGSGGKYLQAHDRDEQGYAIKETHIIKNGHSINVEKNPITDPGKKSKKGYLKLVRKNITNNPAEDWKNYITISSEDPGFDEAEDVLKTVFLNGELMIDYTFEQIRKNAEIKKAVPELETA